MEAFLLVLDLTVLLLALLWASRHDQWGARLNGRDLFDYTDGAECEDCPRPAWMEARRKLDA